MVKFWVAIKSYRFPGVNTPGTTCRRTILDPGRDL